MNYEIVRLDDLSGDEASVYSILEEGEELTLLEKFIQENVDDYKQEIDDIIVRLENIGHKYGARQQWFKLNEGNPGDHVCALYDTPDRRLRLYCIRYGSLLLVIGGGGPKQVRALQEDDKLMHENYSLREIANQIFERMRDGDITFSTDYQELEGDLKFYDDND
ncbi:MAG: hypothetical protein IPL46_10145 [Saprospiraceae bacterium]|nr:hypothetical protein [Saprospiraceae bacterium]